MHFRAFFHRDLMNRDPKLRKKIKGIIFEFGYNCRQSCYCSHGRECKHVSHYRYHNWSIDVRRKIHEKFGVDIVFPWYFQKKYVDFSGTTMCPYKMPRVYTCWDCKYDDGQIDGYCLNKERARLIKEGRYHEIEGDEPRRCKLFDHNNYCQNYDRKTGEIIFDVR